MLLLIIIDRFYTPEYIAKHWNIYYLISKAPDIYWLSALCHESEVVQTPVISLFFMSLFKNDLPFLNGDVPRSPSYGAYISRLIRFVLMLEHSTTETNFWLLSYYNKVIRKAFSKFYHRHPELIVKYSIGWKTLLQQSIPVLVFHGDLVYKFKRIVGKLEFNDLFKKIFKRYKKLDMTWISWYSLVCLVVNPITVYSYGLLFNCTTVG